MTCPSETISVEASKVVCIGDADSPHPRVYLAMGGPGGVVCPYCGKRYVKKRE